MIKRIAKLLLISVLGITLTACTGTNDFINTHYNSETAGVEETDTESEEADPKLRRANPKTANQRMIFISG